MKISSQILLLAGLTWAVGIGAAAFLMYRSVGIAADYDVLIGNLQRENQLQDLSRQMQVKFKVQVQEWKDTLLRGDDPESLRKYSSAFLEAEQSVRSMANTLKDDAPDPLTRGVAVQFAQAHEEMGLKYGAALQVFVQGNGLNAKEADKMVKGQDRAPTELVDQIVSLLGARARAARASQRDALATQTWWVSILLLLGFGAIGVGTFVTVRSLSGTLRQSAAELRETASQVASAASQVATASQALAQGASEQAASLQETSASSEEIISSSHKNSDNTRTVAGLVAQSQEKLTRTNQLLNQTVAAISEVSSQSEKISKIIRVIDEIAFQTNILALNAAVEAARAGDAGMGFAVVADEVRNLAQRSAQAAKDTASLIEESIDKSRTGKARVDQIAVAIRVSAEDSTRVTTLVDSVNLAASEQARGIDQICKAIAQMGQVTQATAANAEESAAAAEELGAQSKSLEDLVARLTAVVEGTRGRG